MAAIHGRYRGGSHFSIQASTSVSLAHTAGRFLSFYRRAITALTLARASFPIQGFSLEKKPERVWQNGLQELVLAVFKNSKRPKFGYWPFSRRQKYVWPFFQTNDCFWGLRVANFRHGVTTWLPTFAVPQKGWSNTSFITPESCIAIVYSEQYENLILKKDPNRNSALPSADFP